MPQRLESPLFREVLRDRPVAYWPMNDHYAEFGNVPKEVTDRVTLTRPSSGFGWNDKLLVRGDHKFIGYGGTGYLAGPTGSPFSPHAGASGKMSVEFVLATPTLTNSMMLFSKGKASNYEYTLMCHANGSIEWNVYTSAGANVSALVSATGLLDTTNRPRIIAVTFDRAAAVASIYLDGREVSRNTSMSGTSSATGSRFEIGHREDNGGTTIAGGASTGHFSFYDYVLGSSRIAEHYRAFRHGSRGRR